MQINKRIEEYECFGMTCNHERSDKHYIIGDKDLLSLLHDFSREVVGEPEQLKKVTPKNSMDRVIVQIRNSLKSEQLERAYKLLEDK